MKKYLVASEKCAQQSVQWTVGILRHFRAFSTPEQNLGLGVLSTPAPPPLTQTVRRFYLGDDTDMNVNAFRHLYNYHFSENRKVWEYVSRLSYEQFTQNIGYSHGSVRNQIIHLMNVDEVWFCELRGVELPEPYRPADFDDRDVIRARWDSVEQNMRNHLAELRDDMLFTKPIKEPEEDRDLYLWQVLLHVINHGTDHRAQVLRMLHDLGIQTTSQDYIFYAYENPF